MLYLFSDAVIVFLQTIDFRQILTQNQIQLTRAVEKLQDTMNSVVNASSFGRTENRQVCFSNCNSAAVQLIMLIAVGKYELEFLDRNAQKPGKMDVISHRRRASDVCRQYGPNQKECDL